MAIQTITMNVLIKSLVIYTIIIIITIYILIKYISKTTITEKQARRVIEEERLKVPIYIQQGGFSIIKKKGKKKR